MSSFTQPCMGIVFNFSISRLTLSKKISFPPFFLFQSILIFHKKTALLRMRTEKITSYNKDSIVETNQAEIVKSQVK